MKWFLVVALALTLSATGAWAQPEMLRAAKNCIQSADPDRSIRGCTTLIKRGLQEHRAIAYTNRGDAYAEKGEYDRAIADYTKAIALNPKFVQAYNNRGAAYDEKGEYDRAIADFRKALEIDPSLQVVKDNLKRMGVTP